MRKSLIRIFTLITVICYISIHIPPHIFWPAAFFSFGIPVVVSISLVLLIQALYKKKLIAFLWFILFLFGTPHVLRTLKYKVSKDLKGTTRVLSINVNLFHKTHSYQERSTELIKWAIADTSSIKCFQEFITYTHNNDLDVAGKLKAAGYNSYVFKAFIGKQNSIPGLAIFSKNEIINTGLVWQDAKTLNAAIFADIKFGTKTIRVYNIHLSSMSLKARPSDWRGQLHYVLSRLKRGSIKRSKQVHDLIEHTRNSPYPYLVCGDFNETPYSYVYTNMRSELNNGFEKRGNGFGFTLNQKPYFLRIDHQFFSKEFKLQKYTVDRSITGSDHFPNYGYYLLP